MKPTDTMTPAELRAEVERLELVVKSLSAELMLHHQPLEVEVYARVDERGIWRRRSLNHCDVISLRDGIDCA